MIHALLAQQQTRKSDTVEFNQTRDKRRLIPGTVLVATIGPPDKTSFLLSVEFYGAAKRESRVRILLHNVNESSKNGRAAKQVVGRQYPDVFSTSKCQAFIEILLAPQI